MTERTRLSIGDYLTMAGWLLLLLIFWGCTGYAVGRGMGWFQ